MACDIPIDDFARELSRGVGFLLKAAPDSPLAAAANLVRRLTPGLPEQAGPSAKNISIGALSIDGSPRRWIWGVSGTGRQSQAVEATITTLTNIDGHSDEIATEAANQILQHASTDGEAKVLEYTMLNYVDNLNKPSRINLTLYTELFPCSACGGETGLGGNILTFMQYAHSRGHEVFINVIYSLPYGGKGE